MTPYSPCTTLPWRTRAGFASERPSARGRLPSHIDVFQRRLEPNELTVYETIPSTTVARALLDCRGLIMAERLVEAAREAARTGLLREGEADSVIAKLGAVP